MKCPCSQWRSALARDMAVSMAPATCRAWSPPNRMGSCLGGLTMASASSPRSMPMVASSAIRSRPVIGSPVSVRPMRDVAAREHVAAEAGAVGAHVAPEVLHRVGDARGALVEHGLAQFQLGRLLGLRGGERQALGQRRVVAGEAALARARRSPHSPARASPRPSTCRAGCCARRCCARGRGCRRPGSRSCAGAPPRWRRRGRRPPA